MGTPIEGGEVQGGAPEAGGEAPGQNPAWSDVLSVLPEEFHSQVTPHFQKWDQSAQQRIESLNSQFEAYKPFAENGISPQDLEQGLQLMYQLNQDPQAVYNALAEAYGFGAQPNQNPQQGQEPNAENAEEPDPYGQKFEQLNQGLELVAQTVLSQHQERIAREAEAELDSELKTLREKHGDFDERYVLSLMAADHTNMTAEQAVQHYQQMVQNVLQSNPRPFAPNVMGNSAGGTGLPSQAIDPRKLDGKGTRDLVAQMLAAANQE